MATKSWLRLFLISRSYRLASVFSYWSTRAVREKIPSLALVIASYEYRYAA
ncbi:hypothetical protein ACF08M_29610 [Streptomyces sp. NPDC015032]|uniref:hypothetical protein n=1 Tax=Streptomyces sp. NPDC015032 TaxID=3364937 RepID=UPI0036F95E15